MSIASKMRLLAWILVIELVSMMSGWITQSAIPGWYETIVRSPLTPPQIVFPIVWPILYVLIAIAGWYLWENRGRGDAGKPLTFYFIQLVLNWSWTPVFFGLHAIHAGFCLIVGIVIFTVLTIVSAYKQYRVVSFLLLPYLIWLLFASYLNAYISLNN